MGGMGCAGGACVGGVVLGTNELAPGLNLNSLAPAFSLDLAAGTASALAVMGGGAVAFLAPVALATSSPVRSTPL